MQLIFIMIHEGLDTFMYPIYRFLIFGDIFDNFRGCRQDLELMLRVFSF